MLVVALAAEAVTIGRTWALWQTRDNPPHLPIISLPQFPFGVFLIGSLAIALVRPRLGVWLHVTLLGVACAFDQWRLQPQIIGMAMLMIATVETWGPAVVKSYLISMWLWSGIHKLLSPDWMSHASWNLLESLPLRDVGTWHLPFAVGVAVAEITLGLLAIFRPRWAAVGCIALHSCIAVTLSPLLLDWNMSVIPWNVAIAIVGNWILRTAPPFFAQSASELAVAGILILMPIGFYAGVVDHAFAHVLYSANVPYGVVTTKEGMVPIPRYGSFGAAFLHSHRTLRQYFELVAPVGSKLHIVDPRYGLSDSYFIKSANGDAIAIDQSTFASNVGGQIAGVFADDPRSIFALSRAKARMLKRTAEGMIYAVEVQPQSYRPELLDLLCGVPNLEQLQLAGCDVTDADLQRLVGCRNLRGIGLNNTEVTELGLETLRKLPKLTYWELQSASSTNDP